MKFLRCKPTTKSGKKIAIIGGGVSGLAAAGELVCKHEVHVLDEMPELGGFLKYGFSSYFFPREGLEDGIKELEKAGVVFKTNVKVDDEYFERIVSEYDAVLIATGTWRPSYVNIEGVDKENVYYAVDLIKRLNAGEKVDLGNKIGVIITEVSGKVSVGGDLVLVDLIPLILKIGEDKDAVEKITTMYRGSRNESKMAKDHFDYLERYYFEFTPEKFELLEYTEAVKILGDVKAEGIEAVKTQKTDGEIVKTDKVVKVETDSVVISSPPAPTLPFEKEHGIELNPDGTVKTDEKFRTTREKVFACGNVKLGPGFLIPAYRSGKIVAKYIDEFLS